MTVQDCYVRLSKLTQHFWNVNDVCDRLAIADYLRSIAIIQEIGIFVFISNLLTKNQKIKISMKLFRVKRNKTNTEKIDTRQCKIAVGTFSWVKCNNSLVN